MHVNIYIYNICWKNVQNWDNKEIYEWWKNIFGTKYKENFGSGALSGKLLDLGLLKIGWGIVFQFLAPAGKSNHPGPNPNPFP